MVDTILRQHVRIPVFSLADLLLMCAAGCDIITGKGGERMLEVVAALIEDGEHILLC